MGAGEEGLKTKAKLSSFQERRRGRGDTKIKCEDKVKTDMKAGRIKVQRGHSEQHQIHF